MTNPNEVKPLSVSECIDYIRNKLNEWDRWDGVRSRNAMESALHHLTAQQEAVEAKDTLIRKYITGECVCPKKDNPYPAAQHFPGCPMINKERIAELEEAVEAGGKDNCEWWVHVSNLLPSESGEYRTLVWYEGGDTKQIDSRFNKRFIGSYWSEEKYGGGLVTAWLPKHMVKVLLPPPPTESDDE